MKEAGKNILDLTADGVRFAPWDTEVKDDDLTLVSLAFTGSSWVSYPNEGIKLELPDANDEFGTLEAVFLSREKRAAVRFQFAHVQAFRVLDEGGLLELWNASAVTPRPAFATFRVKGHAWQAESVLVWIHGPDDHFSHMVATTNECLEVVTFGDPQVEILAARVTKLRESDA
ncbi:MAG TPA: hypothetical protein VHS33_00090 [Sphingomicrobium sp.]|jgi:hypothetical protein|nr:hypothetical protein [Sphingomicrobium sp.]